MIRLLLRQARMVIIAALQDYFSTSEEAGIQKFTWVDAKDRELYQQPPGQGKTLLYIGARAPEELRLLPAMVVKNSSGRELRLASNQRGERIKRGEDEYDRYTGAFTVDFGVIIAAMTPEDRDKLADMAVTCILFERLREIQQYGIILVPNTMTYGAEDFFMYDTTTPVERIQISFQAKLEWWNDVKDITSVPLKKLKFPGLNDLVVT